MSKPSTAVDVHSMRAPCRDCGSADGNIRPTGGQDCVYCVCGRFQYNAPRVETGRKVRSVSSREGLTPGRRAEVMARYCHRCGQCGRGAADGVALEVDHIIPRGMAADEDGSVDGVIDSDMNLMVLCKECNAGKNSLDAVSIELVYRALVINQGGPT